MDEDWYISMKDEIKTFINRERQKLQKDLDKITARNNKYHQSSVKNFEDCFNYVSIALKRECKKYIKEEHKLDHVVHHHYHHYN